MSNSSANSADPLRTTFGTNDRTTTAYISFTPKVRHPSKIAVQPSYVKKPVFYKATRSPDVQTETFLSTREKYNDSIAVDSSLLNDSFATSQSANVSTNTFSVQQIGVQVFCDPAAELNCQNASLSNCEDCSFPLAGLFATFVTVLGVVIILSNLLVIWSVFKNKEATNFDVAKVSLAVSALTTGMSIFAIVLPNFTWSINSTRPEIAVKVEESINSPGAITAGIFFIIGITSSLFHLLLLSCERFYAVCSPMKYKMQNKQTIYVGIAIAWILGLLDASIPAMYSGMEYSYQYQLYLYCPAPSAFGPIKNYSVLATFMAVFYALPYALTTVLTASTGVYIMKKLRRSRKKLSSSTKSQGLKRETSIFVTVLLMVVGFTIALLPLLIALGLVYSNQVDVANSSKAYIIGFYFSMTTSLVNVVIYSLRDDAFKKAARNLILPCLKRETSTTSYVSSSSSNKNS